VNPDGPTVRGLAAFMLGLWVAFAGFEAPLQALVGDESALHDRVNRVRREHNLRPLRGSDDLARVALAHAEDMALNGYLGHINPAGQNPLDRARAAGVEGYRLLAENIGTTSTRGDRIGAIVTAWLGSPDHRENLLNPAFNTAGTAVLQTDDGRMLIVQLYATY